MANHTPSDRKVLDAARKPYVQPSFKHEQVFETMALACGKVQTTQAPCAHNRKNS